MDNLSTQIESLEEDFSIEIFVDTTLYSTSEIYLFLSEVYKSGLGYYSVVSESAADSDYPTEDEDFPTSTYVLHMKASKSCLALKLSYLVSNISRYFPVVKWILPFSWQYPQNCNP